jgi:hypothetical protein
MMSRIDSRHRKISTGYHFQNGHHNTAQIQHCPISTTFHMWVDYDVPKWVIKTCYNNGQKERLCLIIDKCRRQKLCKRVQKISAAAPLRVMASRYNPCGQHPISKIN